MCRFAVNIVIVYLLHYKYYVYSNSMMNKTVILFIFSLFFLHLSFASSSLQFNQNSNTLKAPEGNAYSWFFNGKRLSGVTSQHIIVASIGNYTVQVTQADGAQHTLTYSLTKQAAVTTIFVVGDSTASDYSDDRYPRTGWAQVLPSFFNSDSIRISNHAASGRSSKSFYNEGRWNTVKNAIKPGDFVFIQFAHNDAKTDEERYTNPATTYKEYLAIYITETRAKGGFPVLISSIPRNNWSGTKIRQAHKPYTASMKEEAESKNVPFMDMEAGTMELLNLLGKEFTSQNIFLNLEAGKWINYPNGITDGTHLQEKGAFQLSKVFVDSLYKFSDDVVFGKLPNSVKSMLRISFKPISPRLGSLNGSGVFAPNSRVTLTASPAEGYIFNKWTLDGDTATYSRDSSLTLVIDSVDLHFQAEFGLALNTAISPKEETFKLYPNPAKDQVNIHVESKKWTIQLMDINGKILRAANNTSSLNIKGIVPGLYVIHILTDAQKYSRLLQVIK